MERSEGAIEVREGHAQEVRTELAEVGPLTRTALGLFGVLLPILALVIELQTRMCAEGYLDPIPTSGHAFAIALVPLANVLALVGLPVPKSGRLRRGLGILNGAAIGIAGYYTLVFLPLMPLAVVAIIANGMGLLPLSPLLGLLAATRLRYWLLKGIEGAAAPPSEAARGPAASPHLAPALPGLIPGLLLGMGLLALVNAPSSLANIGLRLASSSKPSVSVAGLKMVRGLGLENEVLKRCYAQTPSATGLLSALMSAGNPIFPADVQRIYYRATGKPFNAVPPPGDTLRDRLATDPTFLAGVDEERGGNQVGRRTRNLTLSSSRLDAQVDGDEAFAYTEWTLEFENRSQMASLEARTLIAVPPGGVVSRVTLWVDGEEREAAFAGRAAVRDAYEAVVQTQRDPVLVTSAGPDRVLVQCFPVLPDGGRMKIRVGMTAPLQLAGENGAATWGHLRLPRFVERNFELGDVQHSIWLEARAPLDGGGLGLLAQEPAEGRFALRGRLDDRDLSGADSIVGVIRDGGAASCWAPTAGSGAVEQMIRAEPIPAASRIIVVVDGSSGMAPFAADLGEALDAVPPSAELAVLLAGDQVEEALPLMDFSREALAEAKDALSAFEFIGGCDAVPALLAALDLAVGHEGARILWIHGAQPVVMETTEALMQFAERMGEQGILHHLQVAPGPHRIAQELRKAGVLQSAPRTGGWRDDLSRRLASWGGAEEFAIERRSRPFAQDQEPPASEPASRHVARLWAAGEVERLASERSDAALAQAMALGVEYQLVTSVTGAVVLETKQQYEEAGLEPVDFATVPILPEPELIFIVTLCLVTGLLAGLGSWLARRRRRRSLAA